MIVNWNLSANQINLTVYEQGVDLLASVLKKTVKIGGHTVAFCCLLLAYWLKNEEPAHAHEYLVQLLVALHSPSEK